MILLFSAIVVIAIILLPGVAGILLYRSTKYKSLSLVFLLICLITAVYLIYSLFTVFDPTYEKVEIKQNIGGTLMCNTVYNSDLHSWQYDVAYTYNLNGNLLDIGSGSYYEREWKKDEQLIKIKDWMILKTGGWIGYDKILIINQTTKKISEFEFTPESIEKEDLWKRTKAKSLINYCCSEVFIDSIQNGQIKLHYKYRTNEELTDKYEMRKIYYNFDSKNGRPILTKIE